VRLLWLTVLTVVTFVAFQGFIPVAAAGRVKFRPSPIHQDQVPSDNSQSPISIEECEVEWEETDGDEMPFGLVEVLPSGTSKLATAANEGCLSAFSNSKEFFKTLHRLRI